MRSCLLFAAAFAGPIAAATAQPVEPQVPDMTLGVALMSAAVGANGVLLRGAGAVSSSRVSAGTYDVTFARNIEGCVALANTSAARFARVGTHTGSVIRVRVSDGQSTNADNPFTMLVFCTQ
jgi:hypothetical protein